MSDFRRLLGMTEEDIAAMDAKEKGGDCCAGAFLILALILLLLSGMLIADFNIIDLLKGYYTR